MAELDFMTTLLRIVLGITFIAHGYNHGWGAGGLAGTAEWFESIGLRPAKLHAAVSAYMEVAAGVALLLGLLVPVATAVGIGTMAVAFVTVHRYNGFFIFKEGYEYVLLLATALVILATLGAGRFSLDNALGLGDFDGIWAGIGAFAAGCVGAAGLLITSWRPGPVAK